MSDLKINNINDIDVCYLFDMNDTCIGSITSIFQLYDIRIQIKKNKLFGYYIIWNNVKYPFSSSGTYLEESPKKLYNLWSLQLTALMDDVDVDFTPYLKENKITKRIEENYDLCFR